MKKKAFSLVETLILISILAIAIAAATPTITRKIINVTEGGTTLSGGAHGRYEIFTKEILETPDGSLEKAIDPNGSGKIRTYVRLSDADYIRITGGTIPAVNGAYKATLYEEVENALVYRNESDEINYVEFDHDGDSSTADKKFPVGGEIIIENADLIYYKGTLDKTSSPKNFTRNLGSPTLSNDKRIIEGRYTKKYAKNHDKTGRPLWHLSSSADDNVIPVTSIPWERIISGDKIIIDRPITPTPRPGGGEDYIGKFTPSPQAQNLVVHAVGGGGAGGGINGVGEVISPKGLSQTDVRIDQMRRELARRFVEVYNKKIAGLNSEQLSEYNRALCGSTTCDLSDYTKIVGVKNANYTINHINYNGNDSHPLKTNWIIINTQDGTISAKFDVRTGLIFPHELLDYTKILGSATQKAVIYDMPRWFEWGFIEDNYCIGAVACGGAGNRGPSLTWSNIPHASYRCNQCIRDEYAGGSKCSGTYPKIICDQKLGCYPNKTGSGTTTKYNYSTKTCTPCTPALPAARIDCNIVDEYYIQTGILNSIKNKFAKLKFRNGISTGFASCSSYSKFASCTPASTSYHGQSCGSCNANCKKACYYSKTTYSCSKQHKCVQAHTEPYVCHNKYFICEDIPREDKTATSWENVDNISNFKEQKIDETKALMTQKYDGGPGGAAPPCAKVIRVVPENVINGTQSVIIVQQGEHLCASASNSNGSYSGDFGTANVAFGIGHGKTCFAAVDGYSAISYGGGNGGPFISNSHTYEGQLDPNDPTAQAAMDYIQDKLNQVGKYGYVTGTVDKETGAVSITVTNAQNHTERGIYITGNMISQIGGSAAAVNPLLFFSNELLCGKGSASSGSSGFAVDSIESACNSKRGGIGNSSGIYNHVYVWSSPYATNGLPYGEGGQAGEYKTTAISKPEGEISINLGQGGFWQTDAWATAGQKGPDGTDTIVTMASRNVVTAKGGKGGRQNQLTHRYDLCYAKAGVCKQGSNEIDCCNSEQGTRSTKDIRSTMGKISKFDNIKAVAGKSEIVGIGSGRSGEGAGTRAGLEETYGKQQSTNISFWTAGAHGTNAMQLFEASGTGIYQNIPLAPSEHNFRGGSGAVIITW